MELELELMFVMGLLPLFGAIYLVFFAIIHMIADEILSSIEDIIKYYINERRKNT